MIQVETASTIGTTLTLCLCSFTNAYLVISVFPYSGYFCMHLLRIDEHEAAKFAGILTSSFFLVRVGTVYQWGRLADHFWGRVKTLQVVLILSAVFSILFGLSSNYAWALIFRGCLGSVNCIIALLKTLSMEVATEKATQKRILGLVVGMRSWGFLIAPALAGFLAEPTKQYPQFLSRFSSHFVVNLLSEYLFFLPSLLGAVFCLLSAIAVWVWIPEPPSSEVRTVTDAKDKNPSESTRLLFNDPQTDDKSNESPWSNLLTRKLMISHWSFSVLTTYVDEAFPLFCMYASFIYATDKLGLYKSLELGCLMGSIPVLCMPLPLIFQATTIPFLACVMGITKLSHSLFFTSMAVLMNESTTKEQRGRMNSMIVAGNSVAKCAGPLCAGFLVSTAFSRLGPFGGVLIFSLVPIMGGLVYRPLSKLSSESSL